MVVGHPLCNHIGASADGVLALLAEAGNGFHGLGVHNGHGRAGKLGDKAAVGLIQRDGKMGVVLDGKPFQSVCLAVLKRLSALYLQRNVIVDAAGCQQPLEGVLHIARRQGAAVGEHHALPQGEGICQPVVGHGVISAQAGHYLRAAVAFNFHFEKPVEHVHGYHVVIRGLSHIHGGDIVKRRSSEHTGFRCGRRLG